MNTVLRDARVSSLYETDPVGVTDQPPFLNACCTGRTWLAPRELLARLKAIEAEAGRRPGGPRWGPRPLDLDILLYGDRIVQEPDLVIPHPRLAERAFALVPLAEIAPEWPVPGTGATVAELAARVAAEGLRRLEPGDGTWPPVFHG